MEAILSWDLDHRIENDPANPYGVDFTIYGNAFKGSAEPGIVSVMKDENGNGLPDDTWYELAGSQHYTGNYFACYKLTYFNTSALYNGDILWAGSAGDSGFVRHNEFHTQPYYPSFEYFPEINLDSMSFSGSRLYMPVSSESGVLKTPDILFGYADVHNINNPPSGPGPDNPYTPDCVEGTGGDAFDISWARDSTGRFMNHDGIDFIRIQTSVNAGAGPLGELSTDVAGVTDVSPDPSLTGETRLISLESIPSVLPVNARITIDPLYFKMGHPAMGDILLTTSDADVAVVENNLTLTALKGGEFTLTATLSEDHSLKAKKQIRVVQPASFMISKKFGYLSAGRLGVVVFTVLDQDGNRIEEITPLVKVQDSTVAEVDGIHTGEIMIKGLKPGHTVLTASLHGGSQLLDSVDITVTENLAPVMVSVSVKRQGESILSRRNYHVQYTDINPWIENNTNGNLAEAKDYISLADVLAEVFVSNGFSGNGMTFRFRKDKYSNDRLYLWQVGKGWEYFYGWGGNLDSAPYRKCWVVSVNDTAYMNNLDCVRVQSGDVISVFQVEDILNEFENMSLEADRLEILPGESVTLTYRVCHYELSVSGGLTVKKEDLNPGLMIYSNEQPLGAFMDFQTDSFHEFRLSFGQYGLYDVNVEGYPGEVIRIDVGTTTGTSSGKSLNMKVYPNPFQDYISVFIQQEEDCRILISDLTGQIIYNHQRRGSGVLTVDTGDLMSGLYILSIQYQNKTINRRIIKL